MEQVWAIWGRTLELDPAYTPVYDHLIIGGHLHASPEQRRDLFRGYTQQESSTLSAMAGEVFGPIINGGREFVLNPETIVALDGTGLGYMTWLPVYAPDQMPDDFMAWVEAGLQERRQRAVLQGSLSGVLSSEYSLNLVLGRPGRAAEVREEALAAGVWPRLQRRTIYDALWEGVALEDAEASVEMADARIAALNGDSLSLDDALDVTVAEIWRHQSDPSYTNPSAAARIRAAAGYAAYPQDLHFEFLAQLLEEWDHVRAGSPAAAPDRLFSILDRGLTGEVVSHSILFAAAQVFEEAGDLEGALEMLDRTNFQSFLNQRYATRLWRESGRLAALTGDAPRAIQEYRRWLTLHLGAEPSVMPEVEAVRAEVERLGG